MGNEYVMNTKKFDIQVLIIIHIHNFILIYFCVNFYPFFYSSLFCLVPFFIVFFFLLNLISQCFMIENFTSLFFLVYL